jgi:hypothetical protein
MEKSQKRKTTQEDSQSNTLGDNWVFIYWDDIYPKEEEKD